MQKKITELFSIVWRRYPIILSFYRLTLRLTHSLKYPIHSHRHAQKTARGLLAIPLQPLGVE